VAPLLVLPAFLRQEGGHQYKVGNLE